MEDGTYVATSAPFGYRLVDGEYTVVPEEAEVVRKIFALYLQGYGVNVIAKQYVIRTGIKEYGTDKE